jgi:tetratricopeptide (TPR) repeat protein
VIEVENALDEFEQRLARYPAERYPVQHATAQFHRGVLLTDADRLEEAAQALDIALSLFPPDGLPVEHAKATNARGVVFRLAGQLDDAVSAFERAATAFAAAELPVDHGAALFNLGLVHRDRDDPNAAADCFRQARKRFDADGAPGNAAAAARELGAALLVSGDLEEAREPLEAAMSLADRAADTAGLGAAANLLGLVHLGADRPDDAVTAFRDALGAHPRTVRPGEHAMAKANLALGYERLGATEHAYLAAVQALGVPDAPEPVREQATATVERLGHRYGAVLAVLDQEPQERWPVLVREEMARWSDAEPSQRRAESAGWLDGQLARPAAATELAEAWLGGLLELPPDAMTTLIRDMLEVLADRDEEQVEEFRVTVSRTVVRFPIPQWMRIKDIFNEVATELGQEPSWG